MVNYMKMNLKVEFIINEKDDLNFLIFSFFWGGGAVTKQQHPPPS